MKRKKMIVLLCSIALAASLIFTGCGDNNTKETSDTANGQESTMFGQISSINGDSVTIALAEMPQMPEGSTEMEMPQMPEGSTEMEMPQMPDGSTEMPQRTEGERPEMPEGEAPSGMPQGGGMMGGLTLTGDEQTITVDKETVITVRSGKDNTEGSVSDLAEEDIVTVVMNGDKVVSISAGGMGFGGMPRGNKS